MNQVSMTVSSPKIIFTNEKHMDSHSYCFISLTIMTNKKNHSSDKPITQEMMMKRMPDAWMSERISDKNVLMRVRQFLTNDIYLCYYCYNDIFLMSTRKTMKWYDYWLIWLIKTISHNWLIILFFLFHKSSFVFPFIFMQLHYKYIKMTIFTSCSSCHQRRLIFSLDILLRLLHQHHLWQKHHNCFCSVWQEMCFQWNKEENNKEEFDERNALGGNSINEIE